VVDDDGVEDPYEILGEFEDGLYHIIVTHPWCMVSMLAYSHLFEVGIQKIISNNK
jgi:hypothetical protein